MSALVAVRWDAAGGEALLTYPDVLQRLGLVSGQRVDAATGWAVIEANHARLKKLAEDPPS